MCNLQNCDLLFAMTFSSSSALFSASSNVLAGALVSAITVQNAQKCPNRVSEESFKLPRGFSSSSASHLPRHLVDPCKRLELLERAARPAGGRRPLLLLSATTFSSPLSLLWTHKMPWQMTRWWAWETPGELERLLWNPIRALLGILNCDCRDQCSREHIGGGAKKCWTWRKCHCKLQITTLQIATGKL
jgi:hypothetical protein